MNVMPQGEGLSRAEVETFVGENAAFYLGKWGKHAGKTLKGWNWCAMLFSIEWMVFRKMYVEAALFYILVVALGTGLDLLLFSLQIYVDILWLTDAFRIMMGVVGNALYYKKAKRVALACRKLEEQERFRVLQHKGNVSATAVAICIILELVLTFFLVF